MIQPRRGGTGWAIRLMVLLGMVLGAVWFARDQGGSSEIPSSPPTIETMPSPTLDSPTPPAVSATLPLALPSAPPIEVRLVIPEAGVVSTVMPVFLDDDGGSWNLHFLGHNVGHLEGTAWVDAPGNIVLAGHVEMANGQPGVFAQLENLVREDVILLQVGAELRIYAVTDVLRMAPTDLSVLYATPDDTLTLITCDGYDLLSNTYSERVVALAQRRA